MKASLLALALLFASAAALTAQAQPSEQATAPATAEPAVPVTAEPAVPAPSEPAAPEACSLVSGYVTDGAQPLAGVTVLVQGTRLVAITNSVGFFSLTLAGPAPAKLLFEAMGYEQQALTTTCQPVQLALSLLPGTRIRQHGKHKGFIVKAGELPTAAN